MKEKIWFIDIDGCLSRGKFAPFDMFALQTLQSLIAKSGVEALLCSGRSLSYIEALTQFFRFGRYALADHGGILYDLEKDNCIYLPQLSPEMRRRLADVSADLAALGVENGHWKMSHGKEGSISLVGGGEPAKFLHDVVIQSDISLADFDVHYSGTVLDIVPKGISKWEGAYFYRQWRGKQAANIAAIGDSHGDLPLLEKADFSACPANAHDAVKAVCDYVSPHSDVYGVIDILSRHVIG